MDELPFLWYQWIRYQRNYPPSNEELNEYDAYLTEIQHLGAEVAERDRVERESQLDYIEAQKKREDTYKKKMEERLHQDVIDMWAQKEKALRVAAEMQLQRQRETKEAGDMDAKIAEAKKS